MAVKKVLVNLDLNGNQIINVRAEVAASAPATGTPGRFYFNTTQQKLYVYTTNGWQQVGSDLPSDIVTGSNLTLNQVILGNGDGTIKASGFTIGKSVPSDALFTDHKVGLSAAPTTNSNFPILFSKATYGQQGSTGEAYVDQYVTYNPSTNTFEAKNINATTAITVNGNAVAVKSYVDQQDQKLEDRISSISGFGRYLSGWDMATGEPTSLPVTASYALQTGDYFIISNVPSSGTKYKPNQTGTWNTSQPFAKTSTNESCVVGGYWKYDGSTWSYFAPESAVTLPSFTNSSKGAIKGNQASGYVYHDSNDAEGLGKVYGWGNKADSSGSHTITLTGDVSGSGSHTNANNSNISMTVTIENGKVTTVKIADSAVTTAKIADDAVDYNKIKAKTTGVVIGGTSSVISPHWEATGNANEYKATITGVTRNGVVRLCERATIDSFNGSKEVECLYEYASDSTGVTSCTAYINSASAPTANLYYFLCRKE